MLNSLFQKEHWDDNDEYMSIVYLLQRNFAHDDLKTELKDSLKLKSLNLYQYIEAYCEGGLKEWVPPVNNWLIDIQDKDFTSTTMQMYLLYNKAFADDNILLAHSYLKTFFDRITAELVFKFKLNPSDLDAKNPNYNNYHTARALKNAYQNIDESEETISKAHEIRNSNPIVHASAEAIAKDSNKYSKSEIIKSIENLKVLVIKLIEENYKK